MKFLAENRRTKLIVEPSAVTTGDIAFNLIVFFLVCASTAPDTGRRQNIPRSEAQQEATQPQHVEVALTRTTIAVNGEVVDDSDVAARVRTLLAGKDDPEDRVVVVKTRPDVPYHSWIVATTGIEEAGGVVAIQREEEREVVIPQ